MIASTAGLYGAETRDAVQRDALTSGDVPVAVYGLGKLGLPVAAVYAERTGSVVGVDIDPAVVDQVNDGSSPVEREPGLDDLVAEQVDRGRLRATTDAAAAAADAAIHVLVVPTPLTETQEPDLSYLDAAVEAIGAGLAPGDVVFVECTVPPGTCAERIQPLLAAESGLDPGSFGVAACPERASSGRALADVRGSYPRIVGGVGPESTRVAELVYGALVDEQVHAVTDAATAAAVKVFEGIYRDVNIALANELGRLTDDLEVDVREAIAAANTQPFCEIHDPGPGVGGHCIPWYPHFLMDRVDADTPLVRTAREVNDSMPTFTVNAVREELAATRCEVDGADVLVLGLTYRSGVAETRKSPARPVVRELAAAGANVTAVDPLLDAAEIDDIVGGEGAVEPVSLDAVASCDPDAIVLLTPHEGFERLDWSAFDDPVVIDGRDALDEIPHRTYTIGRD